MELLIGKKIVSKTKLSKSNTKVAILIRNAIVMYHIGSVVFI